MAKLNRLDSKDHDRALELLEKDTLTEDEKDEVFEKYNPMATNDVGRAGIFFTPPDVANEFSWYPSRYGRVLDLCAGIGILSWYVWFKDTGGSFWDGNYYRGKITEIVALEQNPEFVRIGKKLMPWVTWVQGDAFDLETIMSLGEFDYVYSNPPYGNVPSVSDTSWMKVKGGAQWKAMEIALRIAKGGTFLIPEVDADYDGHKPRPYPRSKEILGKHWAGITLFPADSDVNIYQEQWKGASPRTAIVTLDDSKYMGSLPYGFSDVLSGRKSKPAPKQNKAQGTFL